MLLFGMPKKYQPDFPFLRAIPTSRVKDNPQQHGQPQCQHNPRHLSGSPLHGTPTALFCLPVADPDFQTDLDSFPNHARSPHWHKEASRLCLHPEGVEGVLS